MKNPEYRFPAVPVSLIRAAVVADFHRGNANAVLRSLEKISPDLILAPGDICEDLTDRVDRQDPGICLLKAMCGIAPVFYSLGNHELARNHRTKSKWSSIPDTVSDSAKDLIGETGAVFLSDGYTRWCGLVIGGLCSGLCNPDGRPHLGWTEQYMREDGFRILLSHHPEYYPLLPEGCADLIVAGHAHGGQWRIGKAGVFAPGQGLFPQYTKGVYDGRLVVSAGIGNLTLVPRLFNPPEIPVLVLGKQA